MTMKQLKFNEELGRLVDKEGIRYRGRRIGTVSIGSTRQSTYESAESNAINLLDMLAEKRDADEVISSSLYDSRQEYDSTPYTATITALLYTSKPARFIKKQPKDKTGSSGGSNG